MNLEQLNRQVIACRRCPRLVQWREAMAVKKRRSYVDWEYWGKPVPGFGDPRARVMAIGLAPGAHGSNRTGRQFTGDASGSFLYPALHRAGFSNQANSDTRDDSLKLRGLYLTAAARCAPPANRPSPVELANCQPYLEREIDLIRPTVIVCLGRIAFERLLRIFSLRGAEFGFAHGASYKVRIPSTPADVWILCSYHPSQQNTLTGRLTASMFDDIWTKASQLSADA